MENQYERNKEIMKRLDSQGKISVNELAAAFGVTPTTIRRDLTILESQNRLKRTHGGAVKISFIAEEPAYVERRTHMIQEKMKIGRIAAGLVKDQMTIFLDIGTTVAQMVPYLRGKRQLRILTNSVDTMMQLIRICQEDKEFAKVIFIGGQVNPIQQTVSGPLSESFLEQFFVDMAFIGVGGIHLKGGLTGYDEAEVQLSKGIIERAKESVALLDHSKIGVRNVYRIVELEQVDYVICDTHHPEDWKLPMEKLTIEWRSEE